MTEEAQAQPVDQRPMVTDIQMIDALKEVIDPRSGL